MEIKLTSFSSQGHILHVSYLHIGFSFHTLHFSSKLILNILKNVELFYKIYENFLVTFKASNSGNIYSWTSFKSFSKHPKSSIV